MLFDQVETLQETITGSLYRSVTFEGPAQPYNASEFEERYLRNKTSYALPVIYKGFYDGRYIDIKDWNIDCPDAR